MKKSILESLNLDSNETLNRSQLKTIIGGGNDQFAQGYICRLYAGQHVGAVIQTYDCIACDVHCWNSNSCTHYTCEEA